MRLRLQRITSDPLFHKIDVNLVEPLRTEVHDEIGRLVVENARLAVRLEHAEGLAAAVPELHLRLQESERRIAALDTTVVELLARMVDANRVARERARQVAELVATVSER